MVVSTAKHKMHNISNIKNKLQNIFFSVRPLVHGYIWFIFIKNHCATNTVIIYIYLFIPGIFILVKLVQRSI